MYNKCWDVICSQLASHRKSCIDSQTNKLKGDNYIERRVEEVNDAG